MPGFDEFAFPLRLGFGCAGAWGKSWFPAGEARAVLAKALEAGVRHFDTAGFYADGEAERRLAAGLAERRDPVFISTKTGTRYRGLRRAAKDFTPGAIRADVEASLVRLGRERIDLVYLHGPDDAGLASGLETLSRLKAEGKIARAGVCGEKAGLERAVAEEGVDVIMGAYNILRRENEPVFRRAKEKGIGVVAIAPLAQGLYRRDLLRPRSLADAWHAARALLKNRAELARARRAADALESLEGWTPAQLALAYVHAHPAIDVALTTTTKPAHLVQSVDAAGRFLPPGVLKRLDAVGLP